MQWVTILFMIWTQLYVIESKKSVDIKKLDITILEPQLIKNHSHEYHKNDDGSYSFGGFIEFDDEKYVITKSVSKINVYKKLNGVYKSLLQDMTFDYCKIRSGESKSGIFNLIDPYLMKYSNLNDTCPIKSPVLLKDGYIRPEEFPMMIPNGEYKIHCSLTVTHSTGETYKLGETFVYTTITNH